jgi:hypothetical protein
MRLRHLFCLLALAWCSPSASAAGAPPSLRGAQLLKGNVEPSEQWFVAGHEPVVLKLDNQVLLEVEPGSEFRVGSITKLPIASGPDPMVPARIVFLARGRIDVTLPQPEKRPHFACMLFGPNEVRIINKGGRVSMRARERVVTTASHAGEGLVTTGKSWLRVPEGTARVFNDNWPEGLRRTFPVAPSRPVLSRSLLLEGQGAESNTNVSWAALDNAVYELSIASEQGSAELLGALKEPRQQLAGLKAGRYQVVARAVDDLGLESTWSEPVAFNVVGIEAPENASVEANGVVRLLPGQRVQLRGGAGLEVGYLGFDHFLPAPPSLGLVQRRPITVLLRHPQSLETVQLRLEPLTVHADIEVAREPLRWPAGGLPVTIHLRDQDGKPVSEKYHADIQLSVNLQPLEPKWQRQGSTLSTVLEQPSLKGPWLVRVAVFDDRHTPLGMELAEIAYKTPTATAPRR